VPEELGKGRASDSVILKAMLAKHPQFRRALARPGNEWPGGRSERDAFLARFMARQGMTPRGIARAILAFEGTKARESADQGYAAALAAWSPPTAEALPLLAGMRPPQRIMHAGEVWRAQQRQALAGVDRAPKYKHSLALSYEHSIDDKMLRAALEDAEARALPWADRLPPPLAYGETPNPWWSSSVQARLAGRRAKVDAPLLAFLVAFWYWGRGLHAERAYYLSAREAGKALGFSERVVQLAFRRLNRDFADVVRITPGVRHPILRLAPSFDLVAAGVGKPLIAGARAPNISDSEGPDASRGTQGARVDVGSRGDRPVVGRAGAPPGARVHPGRAHAPSARPSR
jgi:hypothetical protein